MKLTEYLIQNKLYWKYYSSSKLIIPNFTPEDWYECDLFTITKAGYGREFEIKLSVNDFNKDFEKGRADRWFDVNLNLKTSKIKYKHKRLLDGKCVPCQFWFVIPKEIVESVEIPDYAGLITVKSYTYYGTFYVHLNEIKKAPRLHKNKVPNKMIEYINNSFYYRFWNLRTRSK